jgi:pyrroline-5-carboxylate reductase
MHKLTFIGGGNMAAAIIGGLIASGIDPTGIEVVEIDADARARLAGRFGVVTHTDLSLARLHELVVLAVKPQTLPAVAAALSKRLDGQLVLSIAAGVRVGDLSRWLGGHARIVRAMPNTPALVQRAAFAAVRRLYEALQGSGYALDTLSMGMSGDLEAAIAEGATMVRVGTAFFGERVYA